jgi:hypothetical protein
MLQSPLGQRWIAACIGLSFELSFCFSKRDAKEFLAKIFEIRLPTAMRAMG